MRGTDEIVPGVVYEAPKIRVLAHDDGIARVKRFDPITGIPFLAHPVTGEPSDYPIAGVHWCDVEGNEVEPPDHIMVNHGWPDRHDWVELEGTSVVHRPGGPEQAPWSVTHTFIHAKSILFHFKDGDVRYVVAHQPDKYTDEGIPQESIGGKATDHVDWFYLANRER